MERIASFTVDHNVLVPGLYLSRRDGNVVTFDLRFKKPNTGDLLTNAEMHSVEHIIATLLRNSPQKDAVVYFGPMGCQTGFYFLFDGAQLSESEAVALVQKSQAGGLSQSVTLAEQVEAPVSTGQELGTLTVTDAAGETVQSIPIRAAQSVERLTFGTMLRRMLSAAFFAG